MLDMHYFKEICTRIKKGKNTKNKIIEFIITDANIDKHTYQSGNGVGANNDSLTIVFVT